MVFQKERLGKLLSKVGSGVTPKGGSDSYVSEGVPLIRSQNVLWGKLSTEGIAFIDAQQHAKMSGSFVLPNDVLLNITGASIGRACVVRSSLGEANVNQHVCILRVGDKLDSEYLSNFLISQQGQREIALFQAGGNREGLNYEQVKSFEIPLPPLAEQRKIAEILRTWDEAIETAEAELKAKQERKRGLMQKLLAPVAEGSGKGNDWVETKLGVLGKFYSGLSGKTAADFGSGSPFISYNSVFGRSRCYIEGQPLVCVEQGERQNKVTYGDVILTGSSETADEVAMSSLYCDQEPAYLNSFCIGYSYDKQRLIPEYAEHYFRGQAFRRSVFPLAQGSTRFNISRDELAKVEIFIPPIAEQRKVSEILLGANGDIELISNRIEALRIQKRGLMQKLLTGEVRVEA